jgi:hypothetical protein
MALLQTAFLADKFSGLSCVLFLIWMIPIGVKAMQSMGHSHWNNEATP